MTITREMVERSRRAAEKESEESNAPLTETSKPNKNEVATLVTQSTSTVLKEGKTTAQKEEMAILPTLNIKV